MVKIIDCDRVQSSSVGHLTDRQEPSVNNGQKQEVYKISLVQSGTVQLRLMYSVICTNQEAWWYEGGIELGSTTWSMLPF